MSHQSGISRWIFRFCFVFLLIPSASLFSQSIEARIAELKTGLDMLPEDTPPAYRCLSIQRIADTYERSKDLQTARKSIKYRHQIRELSKEVTNSAQANSIHYPNEYQLQLFERLEKLPPKDAAQIWKCIAERLDIKTLVYRHEYTKAIAKAKELNEFFQEHFGEDDYWTAVTAADHAYAHFYRLQVPDFSEAAFKKAIEITSKVKHKQTYDVIDLSMRLVSFYNKHKRYTDSIKVLKECLPDAVKMFGPEDPATLSLRQISSNVYINLGEINKAREHLLEIERVINKHNDNPRFLSMFVKSHLAMIRGELAAGNYARALIYGDKLYDKRPLYTKVNTPLEWFAYDLMYRIQLLIAINDHEELLSNVEALEAHLPKMNLDWDQDRAKQEIGRAYLAMGKLDLAEKVFREIEGSEGILSETSVRSLLAQVNRSRGNTDQALVEFQNLLKMDLEGDQREFDTIDLIRQLGITYRLQGKHENALDCMLKCLDLQLTEHQKRTEHLSRIDRLDTNDQVYLHYHSAIESWLNHPNGFDAAQAFARLLDVQSVCNDKPACTLENYVQQVPKGSAVIQFLIRSIEPTVDEKGKRQNNAPVYTAFIVHRGLDADEASVSWLDLGKVPDVNKSLQAWEKAIAECLETENNRGIRKVRIKKQVDAVEAGEKFQQFIRPVLEKLPSNIDNLVVCPAGSLWNVPWNGLQPRKEGRYLIQSCLVTCDSDCHQALDNLLNRGKNVRKQKMTLVDDVNFGKAADGEPGFEPLAKTKPEADKVRRDWGDLEVDRFSGESAIEDEVLKSLKSSNVGYFATHVHSTQPVTDSSLARYQQVMQQYQNDIDAFTYQSIVLSSANNTNATGSRTTQQILGAEILANEFQNLDLVVLSCCSSASGTHVSRLGNCGVQRAFRLSGSKTVIGSLWPVDDATTQQLMGEFSDYHFKDGKPASESLRMAILKQIKHQPFHMWASWTVLGR